MMLQEYAAVISREYNVTKRHAAALLRLFDDGATVPFISRYRKEATGSMNESLVQNIRLRYQELQEIVKRKAFITEALRKAGALTPETEERIAGTLDPTTLEDIYQPYKPKRRSRAATAREAGLEPLARQIWSQRATGLMAKARDYVCEAFPDQNAALQGAQDIVAEMVADSDKARPIVRSRFLRSGMIVSKVIPGKEQEGRNFQQYFDFSESVRACNGHRYLAMRRGESEEVLKVNITIDDAEMVDRLERMFVKPDATAECASLMRAAIADGYKRLMRYSIENEVAASLKAKADDGAISLFAENLTQLLMAPVVNNKVILAIDPGFRTGSKVAVLDRSGNLMAHDVIFHNPPANDYYGAHETLNYLVDKYQVDIIAIGNGTGGRETENFVASLQLPRKVRTLMVSEQGASIYSASPEAAEEFPDLDLTIRSAVSIGRRVIDPMAELIKIDPKSIGVGQYQHDVNQSKLKQSLDYVVEKCVNSVGVNLNTASAKLLSYVSGIGTALADYIVGWRTENGPFTSRQQLMQVPRMGVKSFQQCAGFLRIPGAENVLDNTGIHPESYELVERIAADRGVTVNSMAKDRSILHSIDLEPYVTRKVGLPTLTDIVLELEKPGRDPRDIAKEVVYDTHVRHIDDLRIGMELTGKVNNITAFGVFVDIGLKENGLIHISQLCDDFIQSPAEVVGIGQAVKVRVMDVDPARGRIALTMKGIQQ